MENLPGGELVALQASREEATNGRLSSAYRRLPGDNRGPMLISVALAFLAAALLTAISGVALIRRSGARTALARRLAGARGLAVGDLADLPRDPIRPVRVAVASAAPRRSRPSGTSSWWHSTVMSRC